MFNWKWSTFYDQNSNILGVNCLNYVVLCESWSLLMTWSVPSCNFLADWSWVKACHRRLFGWIVYYASLLVVKVGFLFSGEFKLILIKRDFSRVNVYIWTQLLEFTLGYNNMSRWFDLALPECMKLIFPP